MSGGRPWTREERRILETTYPNNGAKATRAALVTAGCPRSIASIRHYASEWGITTDRREWSPEELRILHATYPSGGIHEAKRALTEAGYHRTVSAIKTRVALNQITRAPTTWTPQELGILRRYYPATGANGVKAALAARGHYRTAAAILTRAARERIRYAPPTTPKPRPRRKRPKRVAGVRLTDPQRQLLQAMPYDELLDIENNPLALPANSCRQIAKSLQKKRLVKHEGCGLYRLTLAGLPAWRAVGGERAA